MGQMYLGLRMGRRLFARHGRGLAVALFAFCIFAADSLSTSKSIHSRSAIAAAPAVAPSNNAAPPAASVVSKPPEARDPRTVELVGLQDQFSAVAVTVSRFVVAISA